MMNNWVAANRAQACALALLDALDHLQQSRLDGCYPSSTAMAELDETVNACWMHPALAEDQYREQYPEDDDDDCIQISDETMKQMEADALAWFKHGNER